MKRIAKLEQKLFNVAIIGALAFKNGKPRIPALDKNLRQELEGLKVGQSINLLKTWLQNWDMANLAEPIQ